MELPTEEQVISPMAEPVEFTKDTMVEAVVEEQTIPEGKVGSQMVWEKGLELGMDDIFMKYIDDAILFTPFASEKTNFVTPLIRREIGAKPVKDPVTGDFRQEFQLATRFVPEVRVGGVVNSLQYSRTLGAFDDEVFINFFTDFPQAPAYFLIAEPTPHLGQVYYQVYGAGILKQVIGSDGLGMILKSRHEVEIGDLVFLMQVEAEALEMETAQNEPEETESAPDEIIVEPAFKPEPLIEEPGESK